MAGKNDLQKLRTLVDDLHRLRNDLLSWDSSCLRLVITLGPDNNILLVMLGEPADDNFNKVEQPALSPVMAGGILLDRAGSLVALAMLFWPKKKTAEYVLSHGTGRCTLSAFLLDIKFQIQASGTDGTKLWYDNPSEIGLQAVDVLLKELNLIAFQGISDGAGDSSDDLSDRKIKPTPETVQVIRLIQKDKSTDEIASQTGKSAQNIRKICSQFKRGKYEIT